MEQYEQYSELDFLNDPYLQEWVLHPNEEKDLFWNNFITSHPEKRMAVENAVNILRSLSFREEWPAGDKVESSLNEILIKINHPARETKRAPIKTIYQWLSVAAILLVIVTGAYLLFGKKQGSDSAISDSGHGNEITAIQPGSDKALLMLVDGRKIILDNAAKGALADQGGVELMISGEGLSYKGAGKAGEQTLYNTVSTPRGGQYKLILSDGTRVWLNAASSLKFPAAFNDTQRVVELTGEGYFEVAHNAAKPFHVKVNDLDVKVLGTHFNINSYSDEPNVNTTLLEGKVSVKRGQRYIILNPGQQAQANSSGIELRLQNGINVDEVVAWKNGRFAFAGADIKTIMRQVERWYDVNVVYEGNIDETFTGAPLRTAHISQLLKIMEATGKVKFEINGKEIKVRSK